MYTLLILVFCVSHSVGQLVQDGQCNPSIPLFQNFDMDNLIGKWLEIARTETDVGGDCSHIEFTRESNGSVSVTHETTRQNFYTKYQGQASVEAGSARLTLTLPQISSKPIDFWVLNMLPDSFVLTYGCENINGNQRRVYVWQLGKTLTIPSMMQANINKLLEDLLGFTEGDMRRVSHSESSCYTLPDIDAGQSVILPGKCDQTIRGIANFKADEFLGVWHQIQSYYSNNAGGTCNRAQYTDGDDRVNVVNSQIVNQKLLTISGYANVISTDNTGQLNVVLEVLPGTTAQSELLVLGTDYKQWAVTYTCVDQPNNTKQVFSWVSSRTRELPPAAREEVNKVIDSLIELNRRYYQTTNQTDAGCFYVPETVPGEPIIFGGQCDLNIPVVSSFAAVDYMGSWYEIERYPTPFQFGACNAAYYTLRDEGVDVFNTQVVDQKLLSINGFAVPVSDGKLVVSFPVEGTNTTTETDYWVLSTDYKSYSLVYSCRNINDYQQQVTFWKLSRSKQLSQEAQTAINGVISSLPILDQDYFKATDQTESGCFYYPTPQPGVPVVFPGSCEANIPVVPDFNVTRFQGEWFEIAAYPKDPQGGQCINHNFTPGTDSVALNFVSTNVEDQLQSTTSGQLTFYPGETGGRFTLSFVSNGETISFPYYVVATDYTDYAIVYSCMNEENSYFRGIWAWKLSRSQQLSPNAVTQIDNYLANSPTVVLSNDYFHAIDQTDYACFFFPDLAPGAPVILPGQCDDVPSMQNLNLTKYEGTWRVIENYPAKNQFGQCNQAVYTLDTDTTFKVYNNEVVDQDLREIHGVGEVLPNGKLKITFPSSTEPYELTILGTDYKTYSIAYGCNDISPNQRQVQSWKFSRGRSLTPEAIKSIDEITGSITVLNDRYYQTVGQSDEDCFYYPPLGNGPTIFRGQCDENIPVVTNFDAVEYMGLWHDIESYPIPFQNGTCPNAYYKLDANLGRVEVFNTQVVPVATLDTIDGFATVIPSTDNSAKLEVTFPSVPADLPTPYWVLATDYKFYALVYSCQNIGTEHRAVTSWKLSRSKQLDEAATASINNITKTIPVLDERYYITRDQSPAGCFYFPKPEPGKPVVFPGQCDANIPVISNFDLNAFKGEWFEIEAYPKEQQPGQCIRHEFTEASNSSLEFVSTNVFGQVLGTSNGNVTLYPNQNNGRLTLTVTDSNGQQISFPYYVIDTDYTSYALVYSCMNINDDYRGVYAWKLSKNKKELSDAAITAIDKAMADIDILNNDYFEPIDQTDEACFYLPDLTPGEPVIMPGQCDKDLPVVKDFDATKYKGRWRLIESYPSDRQRGQCNQAEYEPSGDDSFTVYNNEVVDKELREINGTATLTDKIEGKLTVTFPNSSPYELWVLGTDYESYSFVYGCQNMNDNRRRVWSWKLSRSTSLTDEANAAINKVISNTNVLNQRYYQTVDQSDDACFYYPPPGVGPTIFRGQCDENILVVKNFDAAAYMGLWHDIESYPMPFQDGGCPNAFYSLNPTYSDVDVVNTQVLPDQTLDITTGYARLLESQDGSAKLDVTFEINGVNVTSPYWVLATDYKTYSLVYSCQNQGQEHRAVTSWKLSNLKSLSATAVAAIDKVVGTIPVLEQRYYTKRDQSPAGCFYFPEPKPGVPVKFPGQCSQDIPVVKDFDLSRFAGVWHEIEAYPKEEQTGDCINHQFVVNGTSLDMKSYNVIAKSLGVTEGTLKFASDNKDAKMVISFVSNGQTIEIPYWIIDTDYTNYALAYSCVNIDDDYRGIWSWKLSNKRELRPVDQTAITNAIKDIDVLGNQYYEPVDQSDEACFYYPEPTGKPVVFPGQCADIQAMPNFNVTEYVGLWRTIESYPSEFELGTCGDAFYSPGVDNIQVYNTEVVAGKLSTTNGTATAAADGSGKLTVIFPGAQAPSEYLVLDTDYKTYSIVYSCANSSDGKQRAVYSWKLSRSNTLTESAVTAINNAIDQIDVLDQRYYVKEDRSADGCFYFPEPDEDSPVVFRGQCDENIPVQENFDAAAYMGTWYSIESYPTSFQDGTCTTANYKIDGELVSVENTQVFDQALVAEIGYAEVVGNAKLNVTFNVNEELVSTEYWVLATDYKNYSLVYSCRNLNNEYKQVNSWKLSKDVKVLTPAAKTAINNVMDKVKVLDQQYFFEEDHSETGCFFYPELLDGKVVLDGNCPSDSDVLAVTNFDLNEFKGVWREVARFPSDIQKGECGVIDFVPGADDFISISKTSVQDEFQTLNIISGNVTDGGRGVISATVGGVPFDALYILDTDYKDYALIYACKPYSSDKKQIYSWKLARSRQGFSATASAKIDKIVTENIDLVERNFATTNQTSEGCFHYPDYEEATSIEFEGHCDETIRGVANFDAGSYVGLWKEIERYPYSNQFGTCPRAFYSAGDGNVLVRNTQVFEGSLLEQIGTATVASTDGSGQLSVDFNVNGVDVNANYYILATDYKDYALVYSCRNSQDSDGYAKRIVTSWKLSRSDALSDKAKEVMEQVISETRGLRDSYYNKASQSHEDCFYIPEVNPNAAPMFRGRCGTVSGIADFDASKFAGWWHELERYPVDNNPGECISSQYESGSPYRVVDTAVANGEGKYITGTVTVSSSGVLTRVLSTGEGDEIVVLATDYDNYALLYSCVDVTLNEEPYRKVWSAKHSKTRVPTSVENVAALDAAIESNEVLYSQFYQKVDQSDQACFHYPEVQNQRVILPGQCDDNIPVVPSFDVAAYGGTWYQIERYPQVHEDPSSTCIGARYILNAEASEVSVLNWEVIDGQLETIEGTATVSSNDGSAKLAVVLPIVGTNNTVTTPLYVLATDYDSYALAYSCNNINPFQRSIGAWKLSRERDMPAAGATAINAYISTREELDPRYFKEVKHVDCIEPSSGALVKSSAIVLLVSLVIPLFYS